MAGSYEKQITIETAIRNVAERRYLLPAIQRKFQWDMDQICRLFDSIMRHYPINSLMLWRVHSAEIREGFRFYEFLTKYVERFSENNPDFDTKGQGEFFAVIDGQQRLTALYIGLKGTYAVKKPRAWWPKAYDPSVLPPRTLYLNLAKDLNPETSEGQLSYDFQFLTSEAFAKKPVDDDNFWFEVGQILQFPEVETDDEIVDHVIEYLDKVGIQDNRFARTTLSRLYFALRREASLNYYVEESQEIDRVLDIFIRTNEGGSPLKFSDLLMSITSANWEDARDRVDELVDIVRTEYGFSIDRDLVMKASVMLTDADVKFQVKNFGASNVAEIREAWAEISIALVAAFKLCAMFGLNDGSLRAKNAVLPIAYYLFHKDRQVAFAKPGRANSITDLKQHAEDRNAIRRWLMMSLVRGVFGRAADGLLTSLRQRIRESLAVEATFPIERIMREYRGTARDLTFDDDSIERLLSTQKEDPSAYSILALLQPDVDIRSMLHKDHLHPASAFRPEKLDEQLAVSVDPDRRQVYLNQENWNSICNLHLLTESENTSKQDQPLKTWLEPRLGKTTLDPLIPAGLDLSFEAFPEFVEARRQALKARLIQTIGAATAPDPIVVALTDDLD